MKKMITLAAAFLTIAAATTFRKAAAQNISLGIVGAAGHSWNGHTGGYRDFKFAPALGIGMVYSHNEHWGYASELLVSHEGYKNDYPIGRNAYQKMTINPVYLRMPMHVVYFFGKYGDRVRPKIYAGPTLGVKLDEKQFYSNNYNGEGTMSNTDIFRAFDFGLNTGAGANFRLGRYTWLNTDIGYTHGLTDAIRDDADAGHNANRNIKATIGIMWGL